MIVSVVSPQADNNGNSIASIFLALGLGAMRHQVMLTHTAPSCESFHTYFGLKTVEDKTSTPTQLVKLLGLGALNPDDVRDYCRMVTDGVYVFTNRMPEFTQEDMYEFVTFSCMIQSFDYIVYDINDISEKTSQYAISQSDVVVINLTQALDDLRGFVAQKERLLRMCKGKKVILLCNHYSPVVSKTKDIAKTIGTRAGIYVIHHNPWIQWACNNGQIVSLMLQAKQGQPGVIELAKDSSALAGVVSKAKISNAKEKQQKTREMLIANKQKAEKPQKSDKKSTAEPGAVEPVIDEPIGVEPTVVEKADISAEGTLGGEES